MKGIAVLMRHGETRWNRERRVMGRSTVGLDEIGRAQVERAVPIARAIQPDLILTSPLVRARETAEIIATGIGVPFVPDAELEEVRYGRWEGMTFEQLVGDADYARYRENPVTTPTPGGETIEQVQQRGLRVLSRVMEANPGKRILFVSHGDIIRTVICHFMGVELRNYWRVRVDNATFSAIHMVDGFTQLKFLNLLPDPERVFLERA